RHARPLGCAPWRRETPRPCAARAAADSYDSEPERFLTLTLRRSQPGKLTADDWTIDGDVERQILVRHGCGLLLPSSGRSSWNSASFLAPRDRVSGLRGA